MIQSFFFCFVFAEYSSYRSTQFKVQALSGFVHDKEKDKKVKGPSNNWDYASVLSGGYSSALMPDLRSDVWTTHLPCCCCFFFLVRSLSKIQLSLKKKYPIKKMGGRVCVFVGGGGIFKTTNWDLKFIVVIGHVDGPGKLLTLGFVVDLLDGNPPLLTPNNKSRG